MNIVNFSECMTESTMSVDLPLKRKKNLSLRKKQSNANTVPVQSAQSETVAHNGIHSDSRPVIEINSLIGHKLGEETELSSVDTQKDGNHAQKRFESSQQDSFAPTEPPTCPLCNKDLTGTTRLQRLAHANQCLDSDTSSPSAANRKGDFKVKTTGDDDDFPFCVLCGKDVSTYNYQRREQHTNRCLDEIVEEQLVIALSKRTAEKYRLDNTYGNTPIPERFNVQACPCCNEDWSTRKVSLRNKVLHMKSCANKRGISVQQLGRRLQWAGWGLSVRTSPSLALAEDDMPTIPQPNKSIKEPRTEADAFVLCKSDDDDFELMQPIAIPTPRKKQKSTLRSNRGDKMDYDLQLAIALSNSMTKTVKNSKSRSARKRTQADRDSSSTLSIEESNQVVLKNLENLLFKASVAPIQGSIITETLPASKIATNRKLIAWDLENERRTELWTIASSNNIHAREYTTPLLTRFTVITSKSNLVALTYLLTQIKADKQ